MRDINIEGIRRVLEKLHGVISKNEASNKVGLIRFSEENESFIYEYFIEEGRWMDKIVKTFEALSPSKKSCYLKKKEVVDHSLSNSSVFNYPLRLNGSFWGILTVQVKKNCYFSEKKKESYRVLFEAVQLYFKGERNKQDLLKEKENLIEAAHTLDLVTEISQVIVSTNSIKEMSGKLYLEMKKNFGECSIGIATNSEKKQILEDCFYHEYDTCLDFGDILYSDLGKSKLIKTALNKKEYIYEELTESTLMTVIGRAPTASYFTPLKMKGRVIGAFTYQIFKNSHFTQKEIDICRRLIPFVTIALNNTLQNQQLSKANKLLQYHSTTDDLTKVYTRRFFYEMFEKNILRPKNLRKTPFFS